MLSSGYSSGSREGFLKVKMEEQTVPSAGFSPQPEYMSTDCGSNNYYGVPHQQPPPQHHHHQQQPSIQINGGVVGGCLDYSNLADSFDLSLLGDSYDDKDMATVPSPSSWSPLGALEPNTWQQISFYAASPQEQSRAFSPDCKPFVAEMNQPPQNSYSGQQNGGADLAGPLSNADEDPNCVRSSSLLIQCLKDNTYIEKYNFKPLDLPITSLPNENVDSGMDGSNGVPTGATGSTTLELNQIEPVFNLAYEQIISDNQATCRTLAISPDPMQWSVRDVQSWLCYRLTSFSPERATAASTCPPPSSAAIRALWNIDGQRLCSLTEEDFQRRDPVNGEKIFANLELLKMWKCTQAPSTDSSFDLGQILLDTVNSGSYTCGGSPAAQQQEIHSPQPQFVEEMKVDVDETQSSCPTSSNPSSVDTPPSSSSSSIRQSDDDDDDEEEEEKPAVATSGKGKPCGTKNGAHIHLWQFLKELLASGQQHGSCIRWLDQSRGVFKIEDSVRVARLWGIRKNRPAMNYDKLSRSIRQYYRKGIMRKTERSQRLVYQFCHPYGL